jgi:hypothetical protein
MATLHWRSLALLVLIAAISGISPAQNVPLPRIEAKGLGVPRLAVDDAKVYSLAELVDFAERNNPETRVAWEGAKNRGAALHIAQSELSKNKALVLEAFDTLFNKRDYERAERYWSPNYIQHSAHIPPVAMACSISLRAFRQRLGMSQERSWPKGTLSSCTGDFRTSDCP